MNERMPYREEGEQAESPKPRVDLCKNCIHMKPAYKGCEPGHWHCWAHPRVEDSALMYVDGSGPEPEKENWCSRKRNGPTCPDFMVNLSLDPPGKSSPWWKLWGS